MVRSLHFTIGTGPGLHPTIEQLSLENDLSLVKASLLYADRVRLCSIGSALALQFAQLMGASASQRRDWLERHFETLAPTYPEEAATMREFFRQYRNLRRQRPGTLNRTQVQLKFQIQASLNRAWDNFEEGIGRFLRIAGADGIVEALDTGLVDLHRFESGGIEGMGGLPGGEDRVGDDLLDSMVWEYFDLIAEAVADGETNPLFDRASGSFVQAGVEAGVIEPSESGIARGRHSGLASDLLQRLPLFERATIQQILEIRRELEDPLARFRGAVIGLSENIRSAAWDKDFPFDADTAFRKAVEPAVLDIEEAVRTNGSLRELLLRGVRPEALGAGLGLMLGSLAVLPDLASLALGSGTTLSSIGREAYKEWRESRTNIESNQMYFYYGARERLATTTSETPSPSVSFQEINELPKRSKEYEETKEASMNIPETDAEREAREFIEENQPLVEDGGVSTLGRIIVHGAPIATELSRETVEAANQLTATLQELAAATRDSATRPRRLFELEREKARLESIHGRKQQIFDDFTALMDEANAAYKQ